MKIYLVQALIPTKWGYDEKLSIVNGEIEEIKKKYRNNLPLRFFKLKEVKK